ncbi:MAG: phosphoribosylaminoimidazolesuccinocarboxamide synthase [Candidatus Altiarchaeales archaeon]|nr:phosphoribosylaminoimidazolesuccinocarboxamide synthase [Candidatus Altiarchaeales archaeon]MBD3417222.1 phosphoribosylaminoimidazolesuccinocarboxamide synthase [Candidatus Altiarchaeales archaeon]
MAVILEADLPLKLHNRGKVRDIYDLGDRLLIIASDRISAFDVVLPNGIPRKGEVLTKLSAYWFDRMEDLVENHMVSVDVGEFPPELQEHRDVLEGRTMLVEKTEPLPIECVARGYLAGSGWKEYQESKTVCGIELPDGLKESDKLPEVIFTPATKAESGHDMNISYEKAAGIVGEEVAEKVRDLTVRIYKKAAEEMEEKGIILCDTKFEFGLRDGEIIFIDEALTPDSSRFWPKDGYEPGRPQKSFDKQYVRDYLETLDWDKTPPGPELPEEVVAETSRKYVEAYKRITARDL